MPIASAARAISSTVCLPSEYTVWQWTRPSEIAGGDEVVGQEPGLTRLDLAAALPQLRRHVRQAEVTRDPPSPAAGTCAPDVFEARPSAPSSNPRPRATRARPRKWLAEPVASSSAPASQLRIHDMQLERDAVGEDRGAASRRPAQTEATR